MGEENPTIQKLVRALTDPEEKTKHSKDDVLAMSISLTYEERLVVLDALKRLAYPGTWPPAKVYRGFRKLTDPDPFDP